MKTFNPTPKLIIQLFVLTALTGSLLALGACAGGNLPPATQTMPVSQTPTVVPTTPVVQIASTPENWNLIWSDEFNGPDGSAVDDTKWRHETGGSGWGNAELEYYTNRLENAYIENSSGSKGVLVIKALQETYNGLAYTSARLVTSNKFEQMFGRFEVRAQIPYGQGIWPAIWMLGAGGGWPNGGEIDIMENIGKEPNIIHGTMHGPGYAGAKGIGKAFALPEGQRFADDFHIYAVEWEPNVIRWYVDNELYNTLTPENLPQGTQWVYDHPFYILLNVAVGGGWPGYPDGSTEFPQTMKVDYVRVYARPGGWPTLTPKP
jgi:beta-glucanase (GH16 family)